MYENTKTGLNSKEVYLVTNRVFRNFENVINMFYKPQGLHSRNLYLTVNIRQESVKSVDVNTIFSSTYALPPF